MTKSEVIRKLILEKEIKEKPGLEFYEVMKELSKIGVNLNQIAYKANKNNVIDESYYKELASEWQQFSREVKSKFLQGGGNLAVTKIWPVIEIVDHVVDYATNKD